ncbi:hypothetical protein H5410_044949 [Solanum commersonii]|uniref:SCP domain-containing protein n=1 Tax=Solanum commersonii TaxID=4109 RepID=A0A9J5X8C4_SOLCO|nr:hypothetical protein H5410_044949 [Solanum commersonii]
MGLFNISLLLTSCLMVLAIFHSCDAQNSPQDYLAVHNDARAQVGSPNVLGCRFGIPSTKLCQFKNRCAIVGGGEAKLQLWYQPMCKRTSVRTLYSSSLA